MKHSFSAAQVRDLLTATQDTYNSDRDYEESSDGDPSESDDNENDIAQADSGSDADEDGSVDRWRHGTNSNWFSISIKGILVFV